MPVTTQNHQRNQVKGKGIRVKRKAIKVLPRMEIRKRASLLRIKKAKAHPRILEKVVAILEKVVAILVEKGGGSSKDGSQKSDQAKNNESKSDTRKNDGNQKSSATPNQGPPSSPPPSFNIPGLDKMMAALEVILKVVFAVGTFLFVLYVVVYKLSYSFGWADDLLDWFRNLFNWMDRSKKKKKQEDVANATIADETLPFEEFDNPFDRKDWQKSSLRELTGYTWKALLAWCKSQNIRIPKGCTPSELEELISNEMPRIEPAYYAFQQVLLNVQYSNNNNDPKGIATTQNLWRHMNGESNTAVVKD